MDSQAYSFKQVVAALKDKYLKTLEEIDCKYLQKIADKYLNPKYVSVSMLLPNEYKGEKNEGV